MFWYKGYISYIRICLENLIKQFSQFFWCQGAPWLLDWPQSVTITSFLKILILATRSHPRREFESKWIILNMENTIRGPRIRPSEARPWSNRNQRMTNPGRGLLFLKILIFLKWNQCIFSGPHNPKNVSFIVSICFH